jgi:hypothetical protein
MKISLKKLLRFVNNERGNVIAIVALSFMSLLGMTGLAIDGGLLYMTKTHLQKTANAAVISGSQELTNQKERVETVVNNILKAHNEETSLEKISIVIDKKLTVDLKKKVKLSFARIFGYEEIDVKAHAAAELRTLGSAIGAVPLGIDERTSLVFGQTYSLKVDSGESQKGNFGILALDGPGAKTYEETFRYGFQEELSVGDVVNTQTGNIAGKTISVVEERVRKCPETSESIYDRDCSRVILVVVFKRLQPDDQKLTSVQVTGFAYFYLKNPESHNDTAIKGIFIKRAGTGFEASGSVNRGAYKIRITE